MLVLRVEDQVTMDFIRAQDEVMGLAKLCEPPHLLQRERSANLKSSCTKVKMPTSYPVMRMVAYRVVRVAQEEHPGAGSHEVLELLEVHGPAASALIVTQRCPQDGETRGLGCPQEGGVHRRVHDDLVAWLAHHAAYDGQRWHKAMDKDNPGRIDLPGGSCQDS
jgi:hypothetical protein